MLTIGKRNLPISTEDHYKRIQLFIEMFSHLPCNGYEVKHTFASGIYMRECIIRKGVLIIGAIHRNETLTMISKGSIKLLTEEGLRICKAPMSFVAPPGTQRIGYTLEDTVFVTIHPNPTNETDIEKWENELTYCGHEYLVGGSLNPQYLEHKRIEHETNDTYHPRVIE